MQTTAAVRRLNRKKVLTTMYQRGLISRTGLAQATGLTGTGITRIIRELLEAGLIREGATIERTSGPGRKETELMICGETAYVVGVSLHVDSRSIVLSNILGEVVDRTTIDLPMSAGGENVVNHIGERITGLIQRNKLEYSQVLGIAMTLAGKVDHGEGVLIDSRVYGWGIVNIRQLLQQRTGLSVCVENVNNALNLAESRFGQSAGEKNVLLVRVGTGFVGASMLVGGALIRGANSAAGLIGHLPVQANDVLCECGRRGCLNTVSSAFGILAQQQGLDRVEFNPGDSGKHNEKIMEVLSSAKAGDHEVTSLLYTAGYSLGKLITQLAETICPETILMTGHLGRSEAYLQGIQAAWDEIALPEYQQNTRIIRSEKTVLEAAVDMAIDQFLLSTDIRVDELKTISQAKKRNAA